MSKCGHSIFPERVHSAQCSLLLYGILALPNVFSHPIRSAGGRIECWGCYGCKTKPSLTSETETSGPSWAPHHWDRKLFSWHMCGLVCLCVFSPYELYVANVLRLHKTWPPPTLPCSQSLLSVSQRHIIFSQPLLHRGQRMVFHSLT